MPKHPKIGSLPHRDAAFIEPMHCAPVAKLADGPGWLFEIKLDGYRAVAVKSDRGVDLFSRRHKLFNNQYPHIVEALSDLPDGTVVDGEVVALDETGRPNFNLLQNFRSEAQHIHYFIFDLLICQDRDLTKLPLSERRKLMKSVLKLRSPHIRIAEQFEASANDMIAAVRQQQLEGVVGKRKDSLYEPGKRPGPRGSSAGESRTGVRDAKAEPRSGRCRYIELSIAIHLGPIQPNTHSGGMRYGYGPSMRRRFNFDDRQARLSSSFSLPRVDTCRAI